MSLDLTRLIQPISPTGKPDLDTSDERLVEIDALAGKDRYEEAAAKVAELLAEDIFDIRPIPYYLYQAFLLDGFAALGPVLSAVDNLAGPSAAAVGPSKRREDLTNKRLSWLFSTAASSLEYHEKGNTATWARWKPTMSAKSIEEALSAGARVNERLAGATYAQAATALGLLLSQVRSHETVARQMDAEAAAKASAEAAAKAGSAAGAPAQDASQAPPQTASQTPSPAGAQAAASPSGTAAKPLVKPGESLDPDGLRRMELVVSPAFVELCRRLKAFETLVAAGKFEKAAVLAADVAQAIDGFDPRAHFPELFSRYVALQSKHVSALVEHAEAQDSPSFRALQQYCRVDLKGFVESDP
jgi:hypothetical protein